MEKTTVWNLIKALGGHATVGRLCGVTRAAVHAWTKRDLLPGQYYHALKAAAALKGLHIPDELFARVLVHPRDVKELAFDDHSLPPLP